MHAIFRKSTLSCLLVLTACAGRAGAQARMTIPFNFIAGTNSCASGAYLVVRDVTISSVVHVTGTTSKCDISGTLELAHSDSPDVDVVALHFRGTGAHHILESIQWGGEIAVVGKRRKW